MHRYIDNKIKFVAKKSKIKYLANSGKWKAQGKRFEGKMIVNVMNKQSFLK